MIKSISPYIALTRLNRPVGIYLLAWPALWALWIAGSGSPDIKLVFIFVLGSILMRSAGCAINDYADRDFDPKVARTKNRPLAQKEISPLNAIITSVILAAFAFMLVLQTNRPTILMSFFALFLAILYPFTKRFTYLPQAFLGAAFSWSIPMAFTAHETPLSQVTWGLFLAAILWTIAYDTLYAMVDRKDDLKIGIGSTAILFGKQDRIIIGALQILVIILLYKIGNIIDMGVYYNLSLFAATLSFFYQQWLIKDRDPSRCFTAFLNNAWTGGFIFCGILLNYQLV